MRLVLKKRRTLLALMVLVLIASFASAAPAHAGCAKEYDDCGKCARKMFYDAVMNLSFGELNDAYIYGIDCDIDMIHCLLFAKNHSYECGA